MLALEENVDLTPFNTFRVPASARWYVKVDDIRIIQELIGHAVFNSAPRFILGRGSNVLFTQPYEGLIVHVHLKGKRIIRETRDLVWLEVMAGEDWHQLVEFCVNQNYGGIENLSLIPGTTGAAPVQNIGAYGAELSEVLDSVQGIDLITGELRTLTADECQLGYRDSIFKHELKEKFFISSITLRLTKRLHNLRYTYGALRQTLHDMGVREPTLSDISKAVISIRSSKLPDPCHTGNAGSFFKNPVIPLSAFRVLKEKYPAIPSYPADNQNIKIPAAWLIEQCGWKGKRIGDAGVHGLQPLVLVNYGRASGAEIHQLAQRIRASVEEKFNIALQPEVIIL